MDHREQPDKPYHHGDLRRAILDAAERRLTEEGLEAVTIRACAREARVSPAAPIHHFGSLKGLLSALAARGFEQLVARLDADLATRAGSGPSLLVGAYVAFAVSSPRMFDLMWREDAMDPDDGDLCRARRVALERLKDHANPTQACGDVTKEATDHFQRGTSGNQQGREGVAEVVDADVGDLGDFLHLRPEPLGIADGLVRYVAGEQEGAAFRHDFPAQSDQGHGLVRDRHAVDAALLGIGGLLEGVPDAYDPDRHRD